MPMQEWFQLHEVAIRAAWYGFLMGNTTGMLFMFFPCRRRW